VITVWRSLRGLPHCTQFFQITHAANHTTSTNAQRWLCVAPFPPPPCRQLSAHDGRPYGLCGCPLWSVSRIRVAENEDHPLHEKLITIPHPPPFPPPPSAPSPTPHCARNESPPLNILNSKGAQAQRTPRCRKWVRTRMGGKGRASVVGWAKERANGYEPWICFHTKEVQKADLKRKERREAKRRKKGTMNSKMQGRKHKSGQERGVEGAQAGHRSHWRLRAEGL
jgi:hypothetical protein